METALAIEHIDKSWSVQCETYRFGWWWYEGGMGGWGEVEPGEGLLRAACSPLSRATGALLSPSVERPTHTAKLSFLFTEQKTRAPVFTCYLS